MKPRIFRTKSGQYHPINKQKYKGHWPLHYRSSWEKKFCLWCDNNPSVITWGLESAAIKYADPTRNNHIKNYLVDFTVTIKDKNGQIHKYYIEIKPYKETIQPVRGNKREDSFIYETLTFHKNIAKWQAATKFAKERGAEFKILTEKELMICH